MFVVKVPFVSPTGKTNGCANAGNEIIASLKNIEVNEKGKILDVSLLDLEEIHVDNSETDYSNELIYKNSLKTFETKPKAIFLGGDGSISFSIGSAFLDYCKQEGKEPCLIIFDAHADCKEETDSKILTNENWLRKLIEKGFPAENILLVGARNFTRDEPLFLRNKNVRIMNMNQISEDLRDTCDTIMEFSNGKELYVSIDVDVTDSHLVPGTLRREQGGLTSRELIYLVHRINKIKNLRVVDIVEINPEMDKDNWTIKLGAKIVSELI